MKTKALVVLSGGQDSTVCLFIAKRHFDEVHAITFDYGQVHRIEIEAAKIVAEMAGVDSHEIVVVPDILKSTSPLTNNGKDLEKYNTFEQMSEIIGDRVEKTFVPMRNTLFLTIAANRAVALGATTILTGICQEDNANYSDTTESFRRTIEASFNESLRNIMELVIKAPLMFLSKADTVRMAYTMPACWKAMAHTHTSYDGKYPPVDTNHSNVLRAQGFLEAGLPDPLVIRAWHEELMDLPNTPNYDPHLVQACLKEIV